MLLMGRGRPLFEGSYMLPVFDDTAVAKDIEAVCSKCGESWHVIVAVSDGKIAQVQCKSCGGYHKYRPIATDRMSLKRNTKTAIAALTITCSLVPIASDEFFCIKAYPSFLCQL